MSEKKEILVDVKHLKKYFQVSRTNVLKAVDDISFQIRRGETVGLVGESGCGKSTAGRCLIRLDHPTEGEIYYKGKELAKQDAKEKIEFCKNVQMIFQNPYSSLNPRMTVREIVSEGIRLHDKLTEKEIAEKVKELLRKVGLNGDHMSRFPHEFS